MDTDLPVWSFIVPFLRAARVFGPARMGRTLAIGAPERQCASSPRLHGPGSAFVAVPRTMILKSFVALTCLLATAMTIAQSSPSVPVAPREPKDVTVHGDRRIDDYFWLRQRDDPRTLPYLRAENAYADAWFAPHAALKEKLYQEMFGRIQQDDDSVPYRKGLWWYSSRTQKGEQYPRYIRRRALGSRPQLRPAGQGRDPARPQRDGARPGVPAPRPGGRHPRRRDPGLHPRPDRRARLHAAHPRSRDRQGRRLVDAARCRRRRGPTTTARSTT